MRRGTIFATLIFRTRLFRGSTTQTASSNIGVRRSSLRVISFPSIDSAEDISHNGPARWLGLLDLAQHPISVEPGDGAVTVGIAQPSVQI